MSCRSTLIFEPSTARSSRSQITRNAVDSAHRTASVRDRKQYSACKLDASSNVLARAHVLRSDRIQRTALSYARLTKALDSLVDYFNSDEHGLSKEVLKTDKYKVLHTRPMDADLSLLHHFQLIKKLLKYHSTDTQSLIKLYFQVQASNVLMTVLSMDSIGFPNARD